MVILKYVMFSGRFWTTPENAVVVASTKAPLCLDTVCVLTADRHVPLW